MEFAGEKNGYASLGFTMECTKLSKKKRLWSSKFIGRKGRSSRSLNFARAATKLDSTGNAARPVFISYSQNARNARAKLRSPSRSDAVAFSKNIEYFFYSQSSRFFRFSRKRHYEVLAIFFHLSPSFRQEFCRIDPSFIFCELLNSFDFHTDV